MTQPPSPYGAPATRPASDDGARMLSIAVLALGGLYTAASVLAEVPLARVALDYADQQESSDLTLALGALLGVGSFVLLLPLWIVTCLWLGAERRRLAGQRHFEHGTAGTFFSWIVPFANFVWPFRVVREVHEAAVEPGRRAPLGVWWTLWLLSLLAGRVSARVLDAQGYGDPAGPVLAASAAYVGLLVAAYAVWVRVVRTTAAGTGA